MAKVVYGDIQLDIRKATNADGFRRELIVDRLKAIYGEQQMGYLILYARVVSQGSNPENLPFDITVDAQSDELCKGYDTFMQMDEDFGNACWDAIKVLRTPADPAMAPGGLGDDPDPNSSSAAKSSKKSGASGQSE